MEKHIEEVVAVLRISADNPLVKNKKNLIKLKTEIMKSLVEAGWKL